MIIMMTIAAPTPLAIRARGPHQVGSFTILISLTNKINSQMILFINCFLFQSEKEVYSIVKEN